MNINILILNWVLVNLCFVVNFCLGANSFNLEPMGKLNKIEVGLEKGELMGFGRVRGTFNKVVGQIIFPTENPTTTSGTVLLDARTLRRKTFIVSRVRRPPIKCFIKTAFEKNKKCEPDEN